MKKQSSRSKNWNVLQIPMQIHVQIPVHCAACVNIYSCSWSVEGGLEKVSQRGEGEILFIEELFPAGGAPLLLLDRFVTIQYTNVSKIQIGVIQQVVVK